MLTVALSGVVCPIASDIIVNYASITLTQSWQSNACRNGGGHRTNLKSDVDRQRCAMLERLRD